MITMGRTILDLFQSKVLSSSGKTAEETYDIRNSKDIPISSRNGLINTTAIPAINLVRKDVGVRTSETRLEQELVGLRPLTQLSSPFIYGTAILRITQQKSDQTEQMKQATGGNVGGSGVIGGLLEKASDSVKGGLSKVGVKFPSQLNPTTYAEKLDVNNKAEIPKILSDIKNNSTGNIAGKVLSQPQTPNQLVRNAAGEAVGAIKNKVRGVLFGERSTTGFNTSTVNITKLQTINYGSGVSVNLQLVDNGYVDANGTSYSKTIRLSTPIDVRTDVTGKSTINFTPGFTEGTYALANKIPSINLGYNASPNPLSTDVQLTYAVKPERYSSLRRSAKTLQSRGILYDTKRYNGDTLNNTVVLLDEPTASPSNFDNVDFIPLKFTLLSNGKTIYFRSIIDGISETFSPSWDPSKFVGNPFSFYTYTGVERSVSFNLKVAATTPSELKRNWERLSFLSSMVYPAGYQDETYVTPPFIKFTLGNIYKAKEGFIESLSYSFDDQMGWEIGNDDDMKEYKLPKKIDVTIGIKFLENRSNTDNHTKLYSFTPVSQ
jgi:hypothetical protein